MPSAAEMAQVVKVPTTKSGRLSAKVWWEEKTHSSEVSHQVKPNDPSSKLRTHILEGKNWLHKLSSDLHIRAFVAICPHITTHKLINVI